MVSRRRSTRCTPSAGPEAEAAAEAWRSDQARALQLWDLVRAAPGGVLLEDEAVRRLRPICSVSQEVERAVMVKGKVRGKVVTPADASEEEIVKAALEAIASKIEGQTVRKTIVAPNVVNVVVG